MLHQEMIYLKFQDKQDTIPKHFSPKNLQTRKHKKKNDNQFFSLHTRNISLNLKDNLKNNKRKVQKSNRMSIGTNFSKNRFVKEALISPSTKKKKHVLNIRFPHINK